MEFDRRLMVPFRPSSRRRTFSSRGPNRVSILGLTPMLFFMLVLYAGATPQAGTRDSSYSRNPAKAVHTNTCFSTKQDFAWRRDHSNCACPQGGSLPLHESVPRKSEGSQWDHTLDRRRSTGCRRGGDGSGPGPVSESRN